MLLPLAVMLCGFMILGIIAYHTFVNLKVNGPLYKKIVNGKDLIADILPPPNYIIESYLLAYELRENSKDSTKVASLENYIKNKLMVEYNMRQEFWNQDEIYLPEHKEARELFLRASSKPAHKFYNILLQKYLPAIKNNESTLATQILNTELTPLYEEHRKHIDKVVQVINDIADQTNLLALNATIEAASAGEAGKGFAVVANEVKELAKQTAQATSEIEQQIEDIQNNSIEVIDMISQVARVIEDVNAISQTIVAAVEEQSATINEIARNVTQVSAGVGDVSQGVTESAQGLNEVSATLNIVNVSIQETSKGVITIRESAEKLSGMASGLQTEISQFKI